MVVKPCWRMGLVLVLITSVLIIGCQQVRLDENLCPRDTPVPRTTVLLLDTSDRLSPKHEEELARIIREVQAPSSASNDLRVAPGEALVVYELPQDTRSLEPVFRVCNPGDHPSNWGWKQELTQGKQIALRQWQKFQEAVLPLFEREDQAAPKPQSPILETLGVLVARYSTSKRVSTDSDRRSTHFILFSDLLQHSETLSHYGSYAPAEEFRNNAGLRTLYTDLSDADISLYRLERPLPVARWQSVKHYYWWQKLITSFGGNVIFLDSI